MTTPISPATLPRDPHLPSERAPARRVGFARALLWTLVLLLLLPGLRVGPVFDDWFHAADSRADAPWHERIFALYDFFGSDEVALGREVGVLPWWTDDALSIRFFRPLSSLTLSLDHLLLDGGGFWSHIHAALWFALTLYAAHRVFRALFDAADARWMTPLYGILSCHVLPLAFVAARHSHVTAAFAFVSFECIIRAVTAPRRGLEVAACAAFVLALLGGESAVTIIPIAFAFVACEAGFGRALRLLAPELAVLAAFAAFYALGGFGVANSGAYLSPGSAEFFAALPARVLVLTGGLFSGFAPDLWMFGAEPLLMAVGAVSIAALCGAVYALRPLLDARPRRRLIALLIGATVSVLPVTAGVPAGRLLIIPCLASAAAFALAARRAAHTFRSARARALLLAGWVALFGIGINPIFRVLPTLEMARVAKDLPAAARSIATSCAGKAVLAVGSPDPNVAYLPVLLMFGSGQRPSAFHVLSMTAGEHRLSQREAGRYELRTASDVLGLPWPRIYRDTPIPIGQSRALRGVTIEVEKADPSGLTLELVPTAPSCWLTLDQGKLVSLETPEVGATSSWVSSPRPM